MFLTPASVQNYTLPFVLEAGDNLTVASKEGAQFTLDMGGIVQLLSLEPASHLFLRNLVVQGGHARQGKSVYFAALAVGFCLKIACAVHMGCAASVEECASMRCGATVGVHRPCGLCTPGGVGGWPPTLPPT